MANLSPFNPEFKEMHLLNLYFETQKKTEISSGFNDTISKTKLINKVWAVI